MVRCKGRVEERVQGGREGVGYGTALIKKKFKERNGGARSDMDGIERYLIAAMLMAGRTHAAARRGCIQRRT
eukprot:3401599-Rhodomonas_salina.1